MLRKLLLLLTLFMFFYKGIAQLQEDKALHFLGGNLFGLVGAGVANQISKGDRTWTFVGSLGGSLLIGLAKESIDESQYNGWDNGDLLATVLGGATIGVTIDIFKQRRKRKREQRFKEAIGYQFSDIKKSTIFFNKNSTSLNLLGISTSVLERNR